MDKFSKIWEKINEIDERVKKLEVNKPEISSSSPFYTIGIKFKDKVDEIGQQKLILIALRFKPKQSKSDLLNVLLSWGIKNTIYKWFRGSNFKQRLLDIGLIMKDGKNTNNEDTFSLTISKGIPKADELIEKYELS
jgi:uncharacterized protein YdcH (DUF465 family)